MVSSLRFSASLPTDQLSTSNLEEEEHQDEQTEDEADSQSQSSGVSSNKSLLLVFRIMFFPTFDCYAFASQSPPSSVTVTQQSILDQVNLVLQARYTLALFPSHSHHVLVLCMRLYSGGYREGSDREGSDRGD